MSSELDHLRRFRRADAAPDPAARVAARAALLERIGAVQAAPAPPPRAARRPRRRLLAGAAGLAGAAAAAVLVVALGSGGVRPDPATAAQLLRRTAVVAAAQPDTTLRPGQYWYVRTVSRQPSAGQERSVRESWRSLAGDGRFVQRRGGGPGEAYPYDGPPTYTYMPRMLTYRQVVRLPTDTDRLYAVIERAGRTWAVQNRRPAADRTREMFTIVGDWLRGAPPLPSRLRAALYRVAARLPDVELLGAVRDPRGRTGVGVAQVDQGFRRVLVIDPLTSQLLMERTAHARSGALVYEVTYVASGVVDAIGTRP